MADSIKSLLFRQAKQVDKYVQKYTDWLLVELPTLIGIPMAIFSLLIVILLPCYIFIGIWAHSIKINCLDSHSPRRYHSAVCEEYQDGEWVEIDPSDSDDVVYHYNGAASGMGRKK